MAKLLKLRRGTTAQHASFTGAEGEVTIDTTKDTAVVHDGAQAGGRPLAREDMSNVSSASIAGQLGTDSIAVDKIAGGTLPSDVKIADANVSGNLTIESADIVDGTIVNADINASANIANSKLADSGVTAGSVGSSTAIPIITVNAKGIVTGTNTTAIDSTTIANGTSNVAVANNGNITATRSGTARLVVDDAGVDVTGNITATGSLTVDQGAVIKGANDSAGILQLHSDRGDDNADQWRFIAEATGSELNVQNYNNGAWQNNLRATGSAGVDLYHSNGIKASTTSSGVSVTGNISVTGTVDGKDISALGITGTTLSNGVTATTQSANDNSTKVATTAYTDTAVANLVDSSPGALNTLNELAAAINDDASFSSTVNSNIATKMPLAGGTFTGNVTSQKIVPANDSQFDLGENGTRYANVYADNFVGSGANLTGIESFVSGMILLWSGSTSNIPSGFVLCNGSNSTPDLRDRFVVGAGNSYSVGATGGSNTGTDTVNISGSDTVSITVSGNATANVSSAVSTYTTHYANYWRHLAVQQGNYTNGNITLPFSGTGTDTVNISGSDTVSIDNRPPYYALCYIMKT